jgi:hypothetical protein
MLQLRLLASAAQSVANAGTLAPMQDACWKAAGAAAAPLARAPWPLAARAGAAAPRGRRALTSSFASQSQGGGVSGGGGGGGGGGDGPDPDAAFQEVAAAFDRLITAAYELLEQGKPAEAEYLLSEGERAAALRHAALQHLADAFHPIPIPFLCYTPCFDLCPPPPPPAQAPSRRRR